jgi:hypothetical protein
MAVALENFLFREVSSAAGACEEEAAGELRAVEGVAGEAPRLMLLDVFDSLQTHNTHCE